jgi:hypothetical protein
VRTCFMAVRNFAVRLILSTGAGSVQQILLPLSINTETAAVAAGSPPGGKRMRLLSLRVHRRVQVGRFTYRQQQG